MAGEQRCVEVLAALSGDVKSSEASMWGQKPQD